METKTKTIASQNHAGGMIHNPEKWKSDYERTGYLVVENLVDPDTLRTLQAEIERITADPEGFPEPLRRHVQTERSFLSRESARRFNELSIDQVGNAVRNIMEFPLFSPAFADLICYEPLLDVLEVLFESTEFHFHNYKCIVKAPHVGSTFQWHRDLPYLKHTTPNLITAMLCLDPMTPENGATVVLPGTHRIPPEEVRDEDRDIPEEDLPKDAERVTVTCPAGSAVLFHVNILHGGGPNRSDIPRRNVIGIWAGPETYPISSARYAYGELYPRSRDSGKRSQMAMTFPHLDKSKTPVAGK